MTASLDDIDAALFSACMSLDKASVEGPFAFVGRWVGALPAKEEIAAESFGKSPALLLACMGETTAADAPLLTGEREDKGLVSWTAIIALSDPRGSKQVQKGGAVPSTQPGMLRLVDAVIGAANGMWVPSPSAATATVAFVGTSNTTYTLTGLTVTYNGITFTPGPSSATTDSMGNGSFSASCSGPPGALGNMLPLTPGTWAPSTPAGVTDTVFSAVVLGTHGLIRNERIRCTGWRWLGIVPGVVAVAGVTFTASRSVPTVTIDDPTFAFAGVNPGNLHLYDQDSLTPSNADPIDVFKTTP